jgi:hypothetical protein
MLIYWLKTSNIEKNAEVPLDASKECGLQANAKETKYMFMSRHQITGKKS